MDICRIDEKRLNIVDDTICDDFVFPVFGVQIFHEYCISLNVNDSTLDI